MKKKLTASAIIVLALLICASLAAGAGTRRVRTPPIEKVPSEPSMAQLGKVLGKPLINIPLVTLSIGQGPCGTPDHAPAAQFKLADLGDLFFCTDWLPVDDVHLQTVEIIAPGGHFYQSVLTPFEMPVTPLWGAPAAGVRKVLLNGRRRPVEVKRLREISGGLYGLQAAFPVAGSYIAQQSLTGLWTVNVYIDYQDGAIASGTFEIVE